MKQAILLSFVLAGILRAEDWPQFLGPRRDGTYRGKALPEWPADGPELLWKNNIGAGRALPANHRVLHTADSLHDAGG